MATINENLDILKNNIASAKQTLATNLTEKGVSNITTANTLTEMATSVSTISQSGGGDINTQWKEIGYLTQPSVITNGINYAKEIQQNWDASRTSCLSMFKENTNLVFMPLVDTSKVTSMGNMFTSCSSLIYIPLLDTSNVTDISYMFKNCSSLTTIPQLDTSNVTNMNSMFFDCINLTTIPQLDTINVTNISWMFYNCTKLTTIPQLDTSNVTNMSYMFYYCSSLTTIPQLDTSNVTNMSYMFNGCSSLSKIIFEGNPSSITNLNSMFGTSYSKLALNGTLYYDNRYDYSEVINELGRYNPTWTAVPITV